MRQCCLSVFAGYRYRISLFLGQPAALSRPAACRNVIRFHLREWVL